MAVRGWWKGMPRKLKVDPKEVRRAFIGSSQAVIGGHRRLIAGLQGVHKWFIGSSCGVHIPLISFQAPWVALGIQ